MGGVHRQEAAAVRQAFGERPYGGVNGTLA
ncbi:hypothetical protein JOF29_003272 [Kribbella aluminosa]|uniref:Uncharacterized protein n=1 Tax=Kribbella aluminosa TaxID=416017 RepID=A0ABS4UKN4_9ACTN|nr:hypothetical protein [Kribbella aluminosa]